MVSGWVCEADAVEIEIDGTLYPAGYGMERADTRESCGDTHNGFGTVVNWNGLGDGAHEVVALVDGEVLGCAWVRVSTLGEEFLRDTTGWVRVEDFPSPGEAVT